MKEHAQYMLKLISEDFHVYGYVASQVLSEAFLHIHDGLITPEDFRRAMISGLRTALRNPGLSKIMRAYHQTTLGRMIRGLETQYLIEPDTTFESRVVIPAFPYH